MSTLSPLSQLSSIKLPSTGSAGDVAAYLPYGMYTSNAFLTGAAKQVNEIYQLLGGNILDIELEPSNVYAAYERACTEYSYIMNLHHAKNILGDILGKTTGSFDETGEQTEGPGDVELKFPRFQFQYARQVGDWAGTQNALGGTETVYSASFSTIKGQQAYDLQQILSASSVAGGVDFAGLVGNKRIFIRKVFYRTPNASWRFFGYYGTMAVLGNLHSYGQFADDSSFELVPAWQNKLQAMAFEDALHTRYSHFSYNIRNNILRLFPTPTTYTPDAMWLEFGITRDPWDENDDRESGVNGISNVNTAPFNNIPYENINSIGKHWIKRFASAICKEILGHIRRKYSTIPIPGENVTLDGEALVSESIAEQDKLKDELRTILDDLTYAKLAEQDAGLVDNARKVYETVPLLIYKG